MKKKKFLLASTLLICFTAQYTLGAFAVEYNDVFNDNGNHSVTLKGNSTGSITNNGTGSVDLGGGFMSYSFTGSLKNTGGGTFTNQTKVIIDNALENTNASTFSNDRSITVNSGASFTNSGTFNNNGTLINDGIFTNSGKYTGSLTNNGTFDNSGEYILSDAKNFSNSGNVSSSGSFIVEQNSSVENKGIFENFGELELNGSFTSSDNNKLTNKKGGRIVNNGSITGDFVNDFGIVENNNRATVDKVTNNGGIFNNNSGAKVTSAVNQNGAIFNNEQGAEITSEVTNDNATFNNKQGAKLNGKFTNQNGAIFNNEADINAEITNKEGGVFNNKGTLYNNQVVNENATVNNEGNFISGIKSTGGVVNNSEGASLGNAELSNGATVNNQGNMSKITGSDSIVNNSGKIHGDITTSESGSGLIVNNNHEGNIEKSAISGATVNNSGTITDVNLDKNATVNNNSNGTITGKTTNVNGGSTLYNDGTIDSVVTVDTNSTLHLGANSKLTDSSFIQMRGHLDLTNGKFDDVSDKALVYGGSNVSTDLSSATGQTDKLWAMGSVTLEDFNFIPDTLASNGYISKEELAKNMGLRYGLEIKEDVTHRALSPLRWLEATSTKDGIGFSPTGNSYKDFNPSVMAGAIGAQIGGYLTELNSFDEAFRNMDMYMLMTKKERTALKLRNKYASISGAMEYDPTGTTHDNLAGWMRPYVTIENVKLKGGAKVDNVAYGSFFGTESEMYELKNGWDAMWGAYFGYNGSHQSYDGVEISQNGGTLGLVGMLYKDDFFTGLTINTGANSAIADTMYGKDDFALLMAGIASKTGYNWELAEGKFIIQPSFMFSYVFVNTFDYTTSSGIKVKPDALNAFTFEPGLKFIGNLSNGWQPYASISVIWNVMDKTKFYASDATLPELSVKPFVKYGVGIRKTWGERFVGFLQTYITNGGRNGIGFQAGFSYTFGKAGKPIAQTNNTKPTLEKTEIKLNNIKSDNITK